MGARIRSAWKNGEISAYISVASQNERFSCWKPNGVSVRLYAPLIAIAVAKRREWISRLADENAP